MNLPEIALTKEMRREVCVHEAGHAVVFALGGASVYRLAVAPEGNKGDWRIESRKGGTLLDLWGVCQPSDLSAMALFMRWDESQGVWHSDRRAFNCLVRQMPAAVAARSRRRVRAHICGCVAGPVASQIFAGEDLDLDWPDDDRDPGEDVVIAQACSGLLPYRNEYSHACQVTVEVLRRPDIWGRVMRLADQLEYVGEMIDDLGGYLPEPLPRWPPSPRSSSPRGKD